MSEPLKALTDAGRANYDRIFPKRPEVVNPASDLAEALGKRFFENGQLEGSPYGPLRFRAVEEEVKP